MSRADSYYKNKIRMTSAFGHNKVTGTKLAFSINNYTIEQNIWNNYFQSLSKEKQSKGYDPLDKVNTQCEPSDWQDFPGIPPRLLCYYRAG